jgi:hypothetical protein
MPRVSETSGSVKFKVKGPEVSVAEMGSTFPKKFGAKGSATVNDPTILQKGGQPPGVPGNSRSNGFPVYEYVVSAFADTAHKVNRRQKQKAEILFKLGI